MRLRPFCVLEKNHARRFVPRLATFGVAVALALYAKPARDQGATVQIRPTENQIPQDLLYPDAVICKVRSPDGIDYQVIFYKSQTVSFANESNNVAEYGTPFLRDPDKFDPTVSYKWRLQLGKPGNILQFTMPTGWTTEDCPVGKSISELKAGKQALRVFAPQ